PSRTGGEASDGVGQLKDTCKSIRLSEALTTASDVIRLGDHSATVCRPRTAQQCKKTSHARGFRTRITQVEINIVQVSATWRCSEALSFLASECAAGAELRSALIVASLPPDGDRVDRLAVRA
ncbi:MAG: hypothetical protein ACREP7_06465, partial [Lysobacter sp.]